MYTFFSFKSLKQPQIYRFTYILITKGGSFQGEKDRFSTVKSAE